MNNHDCLVIRQELALDSNPTENQPFIVLFRENRQKVIDLLRQIPSMVQLAKTLAEGKTYRAYIEPRVMQRLRDGTARFGMRRDSGLLSANILDSETGKTIHNASLMEASPDLLPAINQLATQQTLAEIVQRLEEIDEKITDILHGQLNDRLAEVDTGVRLYEQAIVATDPEFRRGLLLIAIQKLTEGQEKLLRSTDLNFVDRLPQGRLRKLLFPARDLPKYVQDRATPVWKAAHAIVKASRYLALAYTVSDEPMSLQSSLQQSERQVRAFEARMKQIAYWLPPTETWRNSLLEIADGVMLANRQLASAENKALVIEFLPEEIAVLSEEP